MDASRPTPPAALDRPAAPGMRRKLLRVALAATAVVAAAGTAWYALPRIRTAVPSRSAEPTRTEPAATDPAEDRDMERYRSLNEIRLALNGYVNTMREYPASLDPLVPKHLAAIPADPSTGERFAYIRDERGYTIRFSMEHGVFALSAGEHFLTPRGFDVVPPEPFVASPEQPSITAVTADSPAGAENPVPKNPDADSDGDGLTDTEEFDLGTDPASHDTDKDGLSDSQEALTTRTSPKSADTDGDGLEDGKEIEMGTDPLRADTDGDGYPDGAEVKSGFNPLGTGKLPAAETGQ